MLQNKFRNCITEHGKGVMNSSLEILRANSLKKSWTTPIGQLEVLKGVDLSIHAGEFVSIIGPSGSGKSTLLSLLAALDRPSSGTLNLSGRDISQLSDRDLTLWRRQSLGIIFQQFHLMPALTAIENVSLPLEIMGDMDASKKAQDALAEVGLADRATHLPGNLSGGECQRVAIARALVTRPKLLLADEPSGSLDPETGEKITDLIFNLARHHNMAVIIVTHNHELANRCSRRLLLKSGLLTEI
jgi:putative ABC transport system ATP-binding protein